MDINKSSLFYLNKPLLFLSNRNILFQKLGQDLIWLYKIILIYNSTFAFENQIFLLKDPKIVIPTILTFFINCLSL
jgi:hypothetical protein